MELKTALIESWNRSFPGAELPLTFFNTDAEDVHGVKTPSAHMCMIGVLAGARKGAPLRWMITKSWNRVKQRLGL